jgi:hypothetical protein
MQAKLVAGLFIILAVLASYAATYKYGRHVEFLKQENIRKDVVIKANAENEAVKLELQEVRQNAEAALNIILTTPAPRVRIPICPSGESNPTDRGEIPTTTGERTLIGSQELLDEAGRHLESKAAEWSRALNACSVVMNWAKRQ